MRDNIVSTLKTFKAFQKNDLLRGAADIMLAHPGERLGATTATTKNEDLTAATALCVAASSNYNALIFHVEPARDGNNLSERRLEPPSSGSGRARRNATRHKVRSGRSVGNTSAA